MAAFCPDRQQWRAYYHRDAAGGPVAVVPGSYTAYFAAVTGAGAALIGLLFVSVTLRPESVFGESAAERGKTLAAAAFTGLVNTFFLAMSALIPNSNIGYPAVFLALASLGGTARLHTNLSRSRSQLTYLFLSLSAFTFQIVEGIYLVVQPTGNSGVQNLSFAMLASMAIALGRAWALLQGKHLAEPKKATGPATGPAAAAATAAATAPATVE